MFTLANYVSKNFSNDLCQYPNVFGTGVGFKVSNDKQTIIPSLAVFVSKKYSKDSFSKETLIPKHYMGAVTDVIEMGMPRPCSFSYWVRPVRMGYRITIPVPTSSGTKFYEGTAGCIMVPKNYQSNPTTANKYILTSGHVASNDFTNDNPIDLPVYQPTKVYPTPAGQKPSSNPEVYKIGTVSYCSKITFYSTLPDPDTGQIIPGTPNPCDIALVKINPSTIAEPNISVIGKPSGIAKAVAKEKIAFTGATSGFKSALVEYTSAYFNIPVGDNKFFNFYNQIAVTASLSPGDSGCILVNSKNEILGMGHMTNDVYGFFNNIYEIMKESKLEPLIPS